MSQDVDDVSLLIWDSDEQLPLKHGDVSYWQSYITSETAKGFSVPQLVEDNAEHLKAEYLAFIYELGELRIRDKRVIDILELRPEFSYWWMTLLTEKCNYLKSPEINNAIKLMAFKEWFETKDYTHITLNSSNAELAESMRLLSIAQNVGFSWQRVVQKTTTVGLAKHMYNLLPYSFQAFIWLIYHLVTHWPLKGVGVDEWKKSKSTTTFVSYLFNLDSDSVKQGRYESRYWTALPEILTANKITTNWLHIYVKNGELPNASTARDTIKQFNQSHAGSQVHVTMHSFLSVGLVMGVMRDWNQLARLKNHLGEALQNKSDFLWPLFKRDFLLSFAGNTAMSNLLFLALFKKAMVYLPRQEKGCYLQENQAWEFAFIHAWESAGHGHGLIGCPHSTVRYWDMRYFYSNKSYLRTGKCDLPIPDYVGVNGAAAKKTYIDGGYPKDQLVEVEALRYLHLAEVVNHKANYVTRGVRVNTILVLGDYLKKNTDKQMSLLQAAAQLNDEKIKYLVKPHPNCPVFVEDYPELDLEVTNEAIPALLNRCSIAYTSSVTSAAVDVHCAGLTVLTVIDPKGLNLSPLRGRGSESVTFVSTPEEFVTALNRIGKTGYIESQSTDYFYVDYELPRWKSFFN